MAARVSESRSGLRARGIQDILILTRLGHGISDTPGDPTFNYASAADMCSTNALTLAECLRSGGLTRWMGDWGDSQAGMRRTTSPLASSFSNNQVGA